MYYLLFPKRFLNNRKKKKKRTHINDWNMFIIRTIYRLWQKSIQFYLKNKALNCCGCIKDRRSETFIRKKCDWTANYLKFYSIGRWNYFGTNKDYIWISTANTHWNNIVNLAGGRDRGQNRLFYSSLLVFLKNSKTNVNLLVSSSSLRKHLTNLTILLFPIFPWLTKPKKLS